MCFTTFPGGRNIGGFNLPRGWLSGVTEGNWLLFGPAKNAAAVLVDPGSGKIGGEFREETVDLANDQLVSESPNGGIALGPLGGQPKDAELPVTPLSALEAAAFSMNGRYLAVSDRARGAEWDLKSGKLMANTSPFRAVAIDDDGRLQVQFVHHELNPSADPSVDRLAHKYVPGATAIGDPVQYGSIRVRFTPAGMAGAFNDDVTMEAYDALSESHLWKIRFDYAVPEILPADGDQMLFVMGRRSATGNEESDRNRKKLVRTSDWTRQLFDDRGTLVEIVSNRTGKVEHAIESPQLASYRREERSAALFGDLLAVYGNHNNTTIYRVSDGAMMLGFFGRALAGDESLGMIAATNRPQELDIYDVKTGKQILGVTLDHEVLAARFVPQSKELLVLTATQQIYKLDVPGAKTSD
jgi:hypothetical protein